LIIWTDFVLVLLSSIEITSSAESNLFIRSIFPLVRYVIEYSLTDSTRVPFTNRYFCPLSYPRVAFTLMSCLTVPSFSLKVALANRYVTFSAVSELVSETFLTTASVKGYTN
jgi:hypothetical protein